MKQLSVIVVAVLLVWAIGQGNQHQDHQSTNPSGGMQMPMGQTGGMQMGQQGMMPMMNQMGGMGQGLEKLEGAPFEQAFLSMMIPHHRAAVSMARDLLAKTQDTQLRGWANAIIQGQEREITQMRGLLSALGGTNLAAQQAMSQAMMHMGHTAQAASSPERGFIEGMIPHHIQAIEMSTTALQKAKNPVILKLAMDIITAQSKEVYEMRLKLASLR